MKRYRIRRVKIGMSTGWPWLIWDAKRQRGGWAKSLDAALTLTRGESVQFVYAKGEELSILDPVHIEVVGYWGPRAAEDSLAA